VFRYLIRRMLWAVVLFFAVTIVTYIIFFVIPADPARAFAGKTATPEQIQRARHYLGIDKPVPVQYARFVWRLTYHHSLGRSFANREPVNNLVLSAAPVTASLVLGGAVLWLLISLPLGILSALRPRSLLDRTSMTFVLIGVSAHPIWIGLIFSYFLGFRFHFTPIAGYCDFFNPSIGAECGGPTQWAYHMILPWMTFATLYAALYVRMIRANVMEAVHEDYVRTARAKGATEPRVMRVHVLRNALLPVVTILGMDIGTALGGAIFTESIYGLPGLGRVSLQSLNNLDLPTVMGVVVFATTMIILFNLVVDVLYAWVDPRIRLG
jgi:peptide/nickel transport system permease protein